MFAVHIQRHRRLLALCGLSVLVHLALLEWVALPFKDSAAPAPGPLAATDLVLRLRPADAAWREDGRRVHADEENTAAPVAAPAPRRQAAAPPAATVSAATSQTAPSQAAPLPAPAAPPVTGGGQPAPDAAAPLVQLPTRYRVRMPDSVLIRYAQTRQVPGAAAQPQADARLDWRSDGEHYLLEMDGVLGRLRSRGGSGDAGVRPQAASEDKGGTPRVTEFADGEVRFGASGKTLPGSLGIQDRASLLMQLAGIGLGEPAQFQAGGNIAVVVAGSVDALIERFDVSGLETLATPLGPLEAWHLAQPAAPGQSRLEVWLAPARGWLPVQLRFTGPDGVAATQTVSAISAQPNAAQPSAAQ